MPRRNTLMERLGLEHPIIQAPMAGGGDTPDMVIAAGEAGAMGTVGCAYSTPEQIRQMATTVRTKSNRGFGVNLFAPMSVPARPVDTAAAMNLVAPFYRELELDGPAVPESGGFDFSTQLDAVLDSAATLFTFTFGMMPEEVVRAASQRGMLVAGTATTVEEAVALEGSGVDAVIVQGAEAGGHRGTFRGDFSAAMVGTIALVPQVASTIKLPVIATGGIGDGRGIAAALALGASAVQIGTAFLTTKESGIPAAYKKAIASARESDTRITRAFSGRPARGIVNRFMQAAENSVTADAILPFPYQNALTRPMRAAAARQDKSDYLSLWAGQALGLARQVSTAELVEALAEETYAAIHELNEMFGRRN